MSEQTMPVGAEDIIELERTGGDVHVDGWARQELQARGDVLRVERRADRLVVSSAGDLVVSIPGNAHITLGSIGGDAEIVNLAGTVELSVVGGDATLRNLTGPVRVRGLIGGELHLENVTDLAMNSPKAGERFNSTERARRKVEEATRRAEARLRAADVSTERARRRVEEATRRAEAKIHAAGLRMGQVPETDARPANSGRTPNASEPVQPISDEERIAILRMLQDHKITSDQAEMLLTALEGNA
jgi:hypothetical protein